MAAPAVDVSQVVQIAAQAAQAAAQAANALQKFTERKDTGSRFSEAGKVVRQPEPYGTDDMEQDISKWTEFYDNFRAWLFYADKEYEAGLDHLESNTSVAIDMSTLDVTVQERSKQLYSILIGSLRGRPLRILKGVSNRNGYEAWRQLLSQYQPRTRARSISMLSALMNFPAFNRSQTIVEQIQGFERLRNEYRRSSGVELADDISLSILVRCLPKALQQHVQLQLREDSSYSTVRSLVVAYEQTTSSWSDKRIYSEVGVSLGAVGSYSAPGGTAPMEIDAVQQQPWKGKGAGKKGGFGKSKGKGKFNDKGKGKGKGKQSEKGKSFGKTNSFQSGQVIYCHYCGKQGHKKNECYKFQNDRGKGGKGAANHAVRQVEEVPEGHESASTTNGASNNGAAAQGSVRLLTVGGEQFDDEFVCDLTYFHSASSSAIRMVSDASNVGMDINGSTCENEVLHCGLHSKSCAHIYDLSSTDDDGIWTESPWLEDSAVVSHLRALTDDDQGVVDIVLDSGADVSALPLSYAGVGVPASSDGGSFVDAQGNPLVVDSTRVAKVRLNGIVFKEKFIVSGVTTPLLSLGNVMRSGWSIHNDGTSQWLTKDDMWIPLFLKRNSVCAKGRIQLIQDESIVGSSPQAVRSIRLSRPLLDLRPGWNRINDGLFAISTTARNFVDSTLAPSRTLLWLRTTLLEVNGAWRVAEYAADVGQLSDLECGIILDGISEVLTLAHDEVNSYEALGFKEVCDQAPAVGGASASSSSTRQSGVTGSQPSVPSDAAMIDSENYVAPQPGDGALNVPAAAGEAEELVEVRPEAGDAFSVIVDGVALDSSFPLATIRQACSALGLGRSGGKVKCLERIKKHLESQELAAQHHAEVQLRNEEERVAVSPPIPTEPSDEVRAHHNLTHQPYASWCEVCVSNRGRQDSHVPHPEPSSGASVVSFDFGFLNRLDDDDPKLTALFVHDQHTKLVHVVPTPSKGGRYLPYLVTELCRFVTYTQHKVVTLRTDSEPSTLSLLQSARKTLSKLGVTCHVETAPVGSHQSNGAAEKTVHLIRQLANCYMQQLEHNGGASGPVFKSLHPVVAWSLIHAAWVRNHFAVQGGQTPFERAFDRSYNGRVCAFGEVVLGYVRSSKKGLANWRKGIWLTKSTNNDVHVIAFGEHVLCTRSVRRLPKQWDLKLAGDVSAEPWCFGLANIGNKLINSKRISAPKVLTYALDGAGTPDEAASDPPSPRGPELVVFDSTALDELARNAPMSGHKDEAGQVSAPGVAPARVDESNAGDTPMVHEPPAVVREGEDVEHEESDRAAKAPRLSPPDQQMMMLSDMAVGGDFAILQALSLEHDDEPNPTYFESNELDDLEAYDHDLDFENQNDDDDGLQAGDPTSTSNDMEERVKQLCRPYSKNEPSPSPEELASLDSLADQVEIDRLRNLGVLLPVSALNGLEAKKLTTRFVRTWRDKVVSNERCWLRRSRYVAREFSWLSPDRQDLFSPASSSITNRLLPYCFLHRGSINGGQVMAALDIGDAFLTVDQQQPTIVTCELASGEMQEFSLGKVLPGQRDGSLLWYKSLTKFLSDHLQMEPLQLYPCLLKSPDNRCLMLLHVDDILVACDEDFLDNKLLATLNSKYKVSAEVVRCLGDSLTFLKRRMVLASNEKILIFPHPKHFDRLFEIVGVKKTWKAKNTPAHSQILECFESPDLPSSDASSYRSAVGILLYLSPDLVECQFVIRHLAQYMSRPSEKAWVELKHLVQYLLGCSDHALLLHFRSDFDSEFLILKVYTDSDWAANKGTRKSVSANCIMLNNCLIHSASRNQGLIALSSAEAETYAATSGSCDGIFLCKCLQFLLTMDVVIKVLIDNSACRYVLSRAGCGRIRHLSTRILWVQQRVEQKELRITPVSSTDNLADIGAKKLSVSTMRVLMHDIGIYDSEKGQLVGHEEHEQKMCKQNLRLITGSAHFKSNARLIQLIIASSFVSTDALSCETFPAMDGAMAWIGWYFPDGAAVNLLKFPFMQLHYFIQLLFMQLSYLNDQVDAYFHGPIMLVGTLAVLCFSIGLTFRLLYGVNNFSILSRAFSLSGDVVVCLASPLLYKWIDVRMNWLRGEHRRLIKLKLKYAILEIQNRMISLQESKRTLDGIVYNFYDSESPTEKFRRYQNARIEECSDPEFWQEVNHLDLYSDDETSSETHHSEGHDPALQDVEAARQRALHAAREALHYAEINSDFERMEECNETIDQLTLL